MSITVQLLGVGFVILLSVIYYKYCMYLCPKFDKKDHRHPIHFLNTYFRYSIPDVSPNIIIIKCTDYENDSQYEFTKVKCTVICCFAYNNKVFEADLRELMVGICDMFTDHFKKHIDQERLTVITEDEALLMQIK